MLGGLIYRTMIPICQQRPGECLWRLLRPLYDPADGSRDPAADQPAQGEPADSRHLEPGDRPASGDEPELCEQAVFRLEPAPGGSPDLGLPGGRHGARGVFRDRLPGAVEEDLGDRGPVAPTVAERLAAFTAPEGAGVQPGADPRDAEGDSGEADRADVAGRRQGPLWPSRPGINALEGVSKVTFCHAKMAYMGYPSDVSDAEWEVIAPLLAAAKPGGRPRTTPLRDVVNAIFYVSRGGVAWRMLPRDFPAYQTIYRYFRTWSKDGTWEKVHEALRDRVRQKEGREASPSAAIIDSQSAKTTEKGAPEGTTWARKSKGASGIFSSTR